MKIAITGGTGIIGKKLLELLPQKYEAIALSRSPANNFSNKNYSYEQTDYTLGSLNKIFKKADALIHLAAHRLQKSAPDNSFNNTLLDYNIFRACEMTGITNIVFTSTRGVYGTNTETPWTEDSQSSPENPYALAKLLSEQSANYFNQKGLSIKCLRVAQVLSADARKDFMLGTFIENALSNTPLELHAGENHKREYIYDKDVAKGIIAALNKPGIKGIFNLGSGELISIPKLAELIIEKSGGKSEIKNYNTVSGKQENSLMDSSLFYSTFNFETTWTIEEALTDIFNELKS